MTGGKSLLLWGCTLGFVVVPHLLVLLRKSWYPKEKKSLQASSSVQGKTMSESTIPVGTTIKKILKDSSTAIPAKLTGSTSTAAAICRPPANHRSQMYDIIRTNFEYDSMLKGEKGKFEQLLQSKTVLLENSLLECDEVNQTVKGSIAVLNGKEVKNMFLRYTKDNWRSFTDVPAQCLSSSCTTNGTSFDRFHFELPFTCASTTRGDVLKETDVSCKIEFAFAYRSHDTEYWDNNDGKNYQLSLKKSDIHESCSMY